MKAAYIEQPGPPEAIGFGEPTRACSADRARSPNTQRRPLDTPARGDNALVQAESVLQPQSANAS